MGGNTVIDAFIEDNTSMKTEPVVAYRPTTTELLRYEAATQSVMHGLIPTSLALQA